MSASDQELIGQFLNGDTDAFGELIVRYQDRLFNALTKMLGSSEDALDVAQEAFIHAFEKLSTFRGDAAFYSWLFRIAMNAAISRKRRERRKSSASLDAIREQSGSEATDARPDTAPSHASDVAERQRIVQDALLKLSDEFRTVLVLKEIDGMKYEQIAEVVDVPVGTVRSRIHRARCEMRDILRRSLGDDAFTVAE